MIDLDKERVVTLMYATKVFLPRDGQRVSFATVLRWATRGLRGVKLETIHYGRNRCTSLEAIDRFCAKITSVR